MADEITKLRAEVAQLRAELAELRGSAEASSEQPRLPEFIVLPDPTALEAPE